MFIVRARVLLDHLAAQLPALAAGLVEIAAAWDGPERAAVLDRVWPGLTKIAIDHAIAEPVAAAGGVAVVPGDFTWDDVGDFASLAVLLDGGTLGDASTVQRIDVRRVARRGRRRPDGHRHRAARRRGRRHARCGAGHHPGERPGREAGRGRLAGAGREDLL